MRSWVSLRAGLGKGGGLSIRAVVSVEDVMEDASSSSFSSGTVSTGTPFDGVCLCLRAVAPGAASALDEEWSSASEFVSGRLSIDVGCPGCGTALLDCSGCCSWPSASGGMV